MELDGGEISIDLSKKEVYHCGIAIGEEDGCIGNAFIKSGSINIRGMTGIDLNGGSTWNQTGGDLTVISGKRMFDTAAVFGLQRGCSCLFSGGTMTLNNQNGEGIYLPESSFQMSGGTLNLATTLEGVGNGFLISDGGSFSMTGGEINSEVKKATNILCFSGGTFRASGGKMTMKSDAQFISGSAKSGTAPIHLGKGMEFFQNGKKVSLEYDSESQSFFLTSQGKPVVLEKSNHEYSLDMEVTSSKIIAGAGVTIRAAAVFTSDQRNLLFKLPAHVNYVEGSMTADGKVISAAYDQTKRTVALKNLPQETVLHFQVVCTASGLHSISADVTDGSMTHKEQVDFYAEQMSLSLPSQSSSREVRISGLAAPGMKITIYDKLADSAIGKVTATELGTWKTTVTLPDIQGTHQIFAVMESEDLRAETQVYSVTYDTDGADVDTLLFTNTHHGVKIDSPAITETHLIDYRTGRNTGNYYTYDPSYPQIDFVVSFTRASDLSKIKKTQVVTTDRYGAETRVDLTYQKADGTFTGSADYTDEPPLTFRVEWDEGTNSGGNSGASSGTGDDGDDGGAGKDEREAIAVRSNKKQFSFYVTNPSGLKIQDFTDTPFTNYVPTAQSDGSYLISAEYESGNSYLAVFSESSSNKILGYVDNEGENIKCEDCKGINFVIDDGTQTPVHEFSFTAQVKEVTSSVIQNLDEKNRCFTSASTFQAGDILLIDGKKAVKILQKDGNLYLFGYPSTLEIYQTLDVNCIEALQNIELSEEEIDEIEDQIRRSLQSKNFKKAFEKSVQKRVKAEASKRERKSTYEFKLNDYGVKIEYEGAIKKESQELGGEGGYESRPSAEDKFKITISFTRFRSKTGGRKPF